MLQAKEMIDKWSTGVFGLSDGANEINCPAASLTIHDLGPRLVCIPYMQSTQHSTDS